eukprot:865655-Rhodomonas_salina.1
MSLLRPLSFCVCTGAVNDVLGARVGSGESERYCDSGLGGESGTEIAYGRERAVLIAYGECGTEIAYGECGTDSVWGVWY